MQVLNASLDEETVHEQISELPQKQQECFRQCFAAAKVKNNSIRNSKAWVLKCTIMKMKSSRPYNYIQNNKATFLDNPSGVG